MPGTGFAKPYPGPLQFVSNYILPVTALFQQNVHRPPTSGRLAAIVESEGAVTDRYYSDGREAKSSALSYDKRNAKELWNASADIVGLPRDLVYRPVMVAQSSN